MSKPPEANGDVVEFSWGKRRGVTKDKGTCFYASFRFDGVEYSLYDHVFMFKDGVETPFVGKIIKIWEIVGNKVKRRVKVHWLFRPSEIAAYLGDVKPAKNELFLASGKGAGASNVNDLEAIGGKCYVICTSKDERNFQPSDEDLKLADYVFCRTFDVETFKISTEIEGSIEGVEDRFIFNRKENMPGVVVKADDVRVAGLDKADEGVTNETAHHVEEKPQTLQDKPPLDVSDGRPTKKARLDGNQEVKTEPENIPDSEKTPTVANRILDDNGKIKDNKDSLEHDKRVSGNIILNKVAKLSDASLKKSIPASNAVKESVVAEKKVSENLKLDNKPSKISDGFLKKPFPDSDANIDSKVAIEKAEVTRRPENDRSKWFADLPWDTKLKNAFDQDRLVMLDNLDPDYSQAEIEDILFQIFKQNCSVRLIEQSRFSNPYHGQALVIFKTSDAADQAVQKLNKEILILPNGRPLIAIKGITRAPDQKSSAIIGMLSIDKYSKQRKFKEDQRKAAFASHYSQANTIEYEMAIEWMLLHTKTESWWEELHEANRQEIKKVASHLKTK